VTAVSAYIAIGANVDPESNILEGLERLNRVAVVTQVSRFYRTTPLGRPDQPDFLNGVCAIRTAMPPRDLKFLALRRIERACGRLRTLDSHAPRPLDLDIILYGHRVFSEPGLEIPDPDLTTRPFIFVPLLEIAGNIRVPGLGIDLAKLCKETSYEPLHEDTDFVKHLRQRHPEWYSGNNSAQT
jgi:2-amino-4-hydroxy-6-hydroxymethyldihydropteridine diphosphokinase